MSVFKKELEKMSVEVWERKPNIRGYRMADGRVLNLLAEGRLVNLAAGNGHPAEIMDMSFAVQALAAEWLMKHKDELETKVYDIPAEIDYQIGVTKLATTGGFLRAGNTTLLLGVDETKFDGAMKIIEKVCKSRKQIATSPSPISGTTGVYVPYPVEVMVGGATIFVLTVDQFIKL